ncbi:hypothetical protein ACHAWU_008724 [Discostella pseudostelligera]|uniref:Multifunctional methyltransferase subunit TRM112-like protein n=1 Tax=Discostella pseudostelligera TaxID=259834 RepID=A0ABD3M516_9STRA
MGSMHHWIQIVESSEVSQLADALIHLSCTLTIITHYPFDPQYIFRTEKGYPLNIEVTTIRCEDPPSPVDKEFVLNLLPKINYPALRQAVQQFAPYCNPPIPELPEELDSILLNDQTNINQNNEMNDAMIANLHRVLFDVYLVEGYLVCPDTGRKFPVKECIPNMILHEDEI